MTIEEAKIRLNSLVNRSFCQIPEYENFAWNGRDKGVTGKFLEHLLGLEPGAKGNDFSDGELKTVFSNADGIPLQQISVMNLNRVIEYMVFRRPFESTPLYRRIRNVLIVPVFRRTEYTPDDWWFFPSGNPWGGDARPEYGPDHWMFLPPVHLCIESWQQQGVRAQLEEDYNTLSDRLIRLFDRGGCLSGNVEGEYLLIKNSDSKPYRPISLGYYGREVSARQYAVWFKKSLMIHVRDSERRMY